MSLTPYFKSESTSLYLGDCIYVMRSLPNDSVDFLCTDPPYELGFMGKSWDSTGIANSVEMWSEALRVLKPGGHLLAFSGSRTYHRMAVAIEDAGFQIRDQIMWVYGSGFPKSHNIEKAINKIDGVEFNEIPASGVGFMNAEGAGGYNTTLNQLIQTGDSTERAQQWDGWGTALKPAHEPIVLARKPFTGTVANNVLAHGTGGINIDGCRVVAGEENFDNLKGRPITKLAIKRNGETDEEHRARVLESPAQQIALGKLKELGRFPANFIHDGSDEVLELLSEAARFFYCAKTSKKDRNEGLDGFEAKQTTGGGGLTAGLKEDGSYETASAGGKYGSIKAKQTNTHPTVKPTDLMRYLVRLVTPPNGTVLDPFMGSGSTGKAAILEGFDFIGIDMTPEYVEIARARIEFAMKDKDEDEQGTLF